MAHQPPQPAPSLQPAPPPAPVDFEAVKVIGSQYMVPYHVNLGVTKKDEDYTITDINGRVLFMLKKKSLSLKHRHVLVDSACNSIILTVKEKAMSLHGRWLAFKGDSSDKKDLLFNVKGSSIIHDNGRMDVFLADNEKEETCNFRIEGSRSKKNCNYNVYYRNSSTVIAELCKKKDTFSVMVYPNVDYAFATIVALMGVLLDGDVTGGKKGDHHASAAHPSHAAAAGHGHQAGVVHLDDTNESDESSESSESSEDDDE